MMMDVPTKINIGSGRDFRAGYINIDINDHWDPDVVADVGAARFAEAIPTFDTKRFGSIVLAPGHFDEILCSHVLEHVPDLVSTMTNCLRLLKVGGKFHIVVPYDLSYGAWQDPTHLRALNERSWLYYTEWFWYLGWATHRFAMVALTYDLSPEGKQMLQANQPHDVILRTNRAVDTMTVLLEKIPLSEADRANAKASQIRREL
jgi:SAM-dependent methyltransferase